MLMRSSSRQPRAVPALEPIFAAVLAGEKEVTRVLRSAPRAAQTQVSRDVLVTSIPHWLYVGDTPLHLAAAALQPEVAKILLQSGADPNAENRRGATPLHYACDARPRSGGIWDPAAQAAIIDVLVEHGAHLDRGDRGGTTPLHRAVRARSVAAVRTLVGLGARTDRRLRTRGSTPLHLAAQSTGASRTAGSLHQQLEIIGLLREHGADPAALDTSNRTPRERARNERVSEALSLRPRTTPGSERSGRHKR